MSERTVKEWIAYAIAIAGMPTTFAQRNRVQCIVIAHVARVAGVDELNAAEFVAPIFANAIPN